MLSEYDKKLLELLDNAFKDQSVPDDVREGLYRYMNDIEHEKNATSIYCIKIEQLLTQYFLKHRSNNPKSLQVLYHFVISRGNRYKNWASGLALSQSLWKLF